MNRTALLLIAALGAGAGVAAEHPPSILGFEWIGIGDARDAVGSDGRTPYLTTNTRQFEHAVYVLDAATNSYFVVDFFEDRPDYVFGVQVTAPQPVAGVSLHGVQHGDFAAVVKAHLGAPTRVVPVPEVGAERWEYQGRNYTLELTGSKVSSIKLSGYHGWLEAVGWAANWDRYVPSGFKAVLRREGEIDCYKQLKSNPPVEKKLICLSPGILVRARAMPLRTSRPLTQGEKRQISDWWMTTTGNREGEALYSRCVNVREGDLDICVAAQDSWIDMVLDEVEPGGSADFFVGFAGASWQVQDGLFVAMEFQSYDHRWVR